ncbi:GNAT family N-acetyltransferase [Sporosarcina sp. ACRSL]|uniref:GNAT family N-acetyltransferase n=1 Tax=Sporosarcina sp. ACRSL TaxID=2918215 RepID=UPI001EF3FE71|nr:GNAT family N-acetyltransferase [Sporosarcina sp. ACRSL]MCG7344673.1 GNAT family N-acetyltransferase [Sporosarcina sp. ACRSL]
MNKLKLAKFTKDDFEKYFTLVSNESVMAQITERAILLDEAEGNFQKLLERNRKHELFGSYKVFDDDYIGLGHVTVNEENPDEAEIGYMLLPAYWNKGYGTLIAGELIELAKQTNISHLTAVIDPENIPSRKILLKHGFTSEKVCEIGGLPGEILGKFL